MVEGRLVFVGVEVSPCGGPVGGYLTFVISQRHLAKDQQLETAVWAMLSFYAVIAYHVKSYKATMHAKMRKKAQSMIQVDPPCPRPSLGDPVAHLPWFHPTPPPPRRYSTGRAPTQ